MAAQAEKRGINRDRDRPVMLSDIALLWEEFRGLTQDHERLAKEQNRINQIMVDHMKEEAIDRKEILAILKGIGDSLREVLGSYPEDALGRTDFFGHKEDHLEQRSRRAERRADARAFRGVFFDTAAKFLIGVAIFLTIGVQGMAAMKAILGG